MLWTLFWTHGHDYMNISWMCGQDAMNFILNIMMDKMLWTLFWTYGQDAMSINLNTYTLDAENILWTYKLINAMNIILNI